MTPRRDLAPLIALAILLAFTLALQVWFTYDSIDAQVHTTTFARVPFNISSPEGTLTQLQNEATAAGLAKGDTAVSMEGRPLRGMGPLSSVVAEHRAGDAVPVVIERNGSPISVSIRLAPLSAQPLKVSEWVLTAFLYYLTPWFCLALGFTVAFLRPRDLLAWLLLLLMLSFKEVSQGDGFMQIALGWPAWARPAAVFSHALLNGSWPLAMMLFGQYFPDRVRKGLWNRVAIWVLGLPLAVTTVLVAFVNVLATEDATAMAGFTTWLNRLAIPLVVMAMLAISTFFINTLRKMAGAQSRDDKRRLKLLYGGTTIAFTPLFLVVVASLIFKSAMAHPPEWLVIPILLLMFLFPLTLAYVIVVEKAMELRVVVRQGLQYALARRGLRVLTGIVFTILILLAFRIISEPGLRRPQQLMVLAFTVVIIVRLRQLADWLRGWIDRRFFREAVNVERVLNELSESVRAIVEVQPLLATVTKTISNTMHVPRVAAMLRQNGDFAPAHAVGFACAPDVRFSARGAMAERLARSRDAEHVSQARLESWTGREMEDRKQLERLETELLLPLSVKDRLLGFLSLGPKLSEEPYSPTDVRLLESVASQTGLALENTRLTEAVASEVAQRERLNRELEIAREVQQRLFPQAGPAVPGLEYAGKCRPASSVGGDYYDFVEMCDGRLGIAIGDISGKGVPAALLMASLQASLRGLAIANPPALSTLMVNLNRLVFDASPSNRYATFFYGVYNPSTREFMYVNGGHNPPMVFRGAEVLRLEDGGPVIGLFGPAQYQQATVQLERGDTLLLFTDGVSEAMNNDDEEFDEPRLMEAVRSGEGLDPAGVIDRVMAACDAFAAGAPQHDDMTLVVARVV
jgi:sigma-B regulation protein RsbU (phosphoserine phosphatase)